MVWIWEAEVCWDWGQGPTAGPGSSWGHMGLGKGLKAHYFSLSHSDSKAWYLWCHSLDMGQDPCRVGPGSRGKKRSKRGKNLRVPERRKVWHSNTTSDFQKELTFHGFFKFFFFKKNIFHTIHLLKKIGKFSRGKWICYLLYTSKF